MTPFTNNGIALDLANSIKVLIQITRKASRKSDIFTFTGLSPKSSKPFFENFNGHSGRKKILREKIPK